MHIHKQAFCSCGVPVPFTFAISFDPIPLILPLRVIASSRLTPNRTVARNVAFSSSHHRLPSRLGLRSVIVVRILAWSWSHYPSSPSFPTADHFLLFHLPVYPPLGSTSLHITAIKTTPCSHGTFYLNVQTFKSSKASSVFLFTNSAYPC